MIHEILPEFDRSGSEQRHWQVLRALRARGCAVTYVARNAVNKDRYIAALREIGITVYAHDVERLAYRGITGPRDWSFEDVLKEGQFDAAFLLQWFWSGISVAEQYLDDIRRISPATRIIAVCDDPHGPRELDLARLTGKAVDWERARDYDQREREIYGRADLVVTVSESNRRNLREMNPEWDIEILPNEAESMIEPGTRRSFAGRKDLLFLGDFSNFANRDGLEWFLAEVWPKLRVRLPEVQLHLAGSNLPQDFASGVKGVSCLGFVPSLKDTFDAHRVFVSPARYGISTRTKNLNALGQAIPLVTTTAGAEGLFLTHEKNALLADDPEEFAEAVFRAYTDARLWESLSGHGPAHLRETFSLQRLGNALGAILDRAEAITPRKFEPDHAWSVRRIEQRFPQLLAPAPHENLLLVRTLCHLREAGELLDRGEYAQALEQLRHPFSFVHGEAPRNVVFARLFLALERCYGELRDTEAALRSRAEARLCLPPPATNSPATESVRAPILHRKGRLRFSVTIPTYNRRATLEKCLAAFAAQDFPAEDFEVVMVDDGSTDGTKEFCASYRAPFSFHYSRQENSGTGAARRKTIEQARGEYVLLCNDDTIAAPDLLAQHLRAHERHRSEKIAVLGDFRYPPEAVERALTCYLSWHPFLFPKVSLQPGLHAKNAFFVGCNMSIRREAVVAAGSFDP
ncbi:MAG: glycosyltransferase, partial [Candidatus Acidiferrales bacterium]